MLEKQIKRKRRKKRVRAKVYGTSKVPRLSVFRSAKHIYAQIIDDDIGKTIISANDSQIILSKKSDSGKKEVKNERKVVVAEKVGELIAKKAVEKKIKKVVFDRAGYKYHGRVKALAEGARKAGLEF